MTNKEKYFGSTANIAEFIQDYCQMVTTSTRGCDACTFWAIGGSECPFSEYDHEEWLWEEEE